MVECFAVAAVQLSHAILTIRDWPQAGCKRKHSHLGQHGPEGTATQQLPQSPGISKCAASTSPQDSEQPVASASSCAPCPATAQSEDCQQQTVTRLADVFSLEHYRATMAQMRSCGYPLALKGQEGQDVLPEGYVSTAHSGELTGLTGLYENKRKVYAVRRFNYASRR